jgi:glycosyltransferase involved in cell wall biosynthesis
MRIAQVAPLYESVPPKLYGGTERVVSYLTEELVNRGYDVTLYASGDSETSARLVPASPAALWHMPDCRNPLPWHVRLVDRVARDAHRYDLIHFHLDFVHFPEISRLPCPSVTTLHSRIHAPDDAAIFATFPDVPLVSISDDQRRPIPHANWRATVHHGLPADLFTFRNEPGDYLAFLGRIAPEKGLDTAVAIAERTGLPLRVAGKISPEDRAYYDRVIDPLFRSASDVQYLGEVGGAEKNAFLGHARALLFPIDWDEPFGLVMIEALACGTPVIAFRRGSVPEVLTDGVTGYVVDGAGAAADAVGRIDCIDRRACRAAFDRRFRAERMAQDYLAVYRDLLREPVSLTEAVPQSLSRQPALAAAALLGPVRLAAPGMSP